MKYREFKKTGDKISLLGFGTMRFPVVNGNEKEIDEAKAIKMIRAAIDRGVNYVDTAYMYHMGNSEVILGKALKDGYREKVFLADKIPVWFAKEESEVEVMFEKQFKRLDVECIDMYLIHNVTKSIWKKCQKYNTLAFLEKKKAEGKIKHIGFSFHDDFDFFEQVIDSYPWDFCQIQLNYMDAEFQAGVKGLEYAGSKNIPVIIMEPLKGGRLTDALPPTIENFWSEIPSERTPAEWALRWVADFPQVLTILSGMTTMEQVDENIRVLSETEPNSLTSKEKELIKKVSDEYNRLIKHSCTTCNYCMPCPKKIYIPMIIQCYNDWFLYDQNEKTKGDYNTWIIKDRTASDCDNCKACEEKCPQHLPITEILSKSAEIFDK